MWTLLTEMKKCMQKELHQSLHRIMLALAISVLGLGCESSEFSKGAAVGQSTPDSVLEEPSNPRDEDWISPSRFERVDASCMAEELNEMATTEATWIPETETLFVSIYGAPPTLDIALKIHNPDNQPPTTRVQLFFL